jgi:hypothetical protein
MGLAGELVTRLYDRVDQRRFSGAETRKTLTNALGHEHHSLGY